MKKFVWPSLITWWDLLFAAIIILDFIYNKYNLYLILLEDINYIGLSEISWENP